MKRNIGIIIRLILKGEDSGNISINIGTKDKKNKHTNCFPYIVLTRNHRDISIRKRNMFVFLVLMLSLYRGIPSEDNIRKTSVFLLLMLSAYVYAYAYALVKTNLRPAIIVVINTKNTRLTKTIP